MRISKSAVQIHLRAACEKLNAHNTTHGVALAIAQNLIQIPKHPHIADLEHHAFSLGLYDIAEAYLLDRYSMESSANMPDKLRNDYEQFLRDLINGTKPA